MWPFEFECDFEVTKEDSLDDFEPVAWCFLPRCFHCCFNRSKEGQSALLRATDEVRPCLWWGAGPFFVWPFEFECDLGMDETLSS